MKNVSQHFYLFLCLSLFFSCSSDDESPSPGTGTIDTPDGKSMFIVEYEQSGDLDVFQKSFGMGKGFLYFGTENKVPVGLSNDDLKENRYKFITEEPIRELDFGLSLFWIDVPNFEYAEMEVNIKVFRDEELIDSIYVYHNSDSLTFVDQWEYEGN